MKITFVNNPASDEGHPPLGLCYLASYLREHNSDIEIAIVDKANNPVKETLKSKPDIIGISSTTTLFNKVVDFAREIRSRLDVPVIAGGVHITSVPDSLGSYFDVAVIGEGEQTMLELVQAFEKKGCFAAEDLKKIKGIVFRDMGGIEIAKKRALLEPLDILPYPARDLLDMKSYTAPRRNVTKKEYRKGTHIITSRGCPYNCAFCSSSCFWGRSIRYHSAEYVVGEMKKVIADYNLDAICLFDDLFIANKNRVKRIVELINAEGIDKDIIFSCSARANLIDDEICKLLKEMGVHTVAVGFESGSQKVLDYLKSGTLKVEQSRRAALLLKKHGFEVEGLFMVGSPYETKEDMLRTFDFIRNSNIDTVQVSYTTPFPGTALWEYAKKKGLVSDNMNWNNLDLNFPENREQLDKKIFLGKMSKEEFMEVSEMIKAERNKRNSLTAITPKEIFSMNLLKRAALHPSLAAKVLLNAIKHGGKK